MLCVHQEARNGRTLGCMRNRVRDSKAGPGTSRAQVRAALAQIHRRGWDASEGQATPGFKENLKNI
jgi:DNA-binding IclR family transcriptional regulator